MTTMLNDVLTMGQVESGTLKFNPSFLDLTAFCRTIAEEISQIAKEHPIHFSSQGACSSVYVDAKLLRHILGNLLSNATKYSPAGTPVTFTLECTPEHITFTIQDQGIGIPEADQARLFEAFHRASNAKPLPGTGLGLAIVKQSVELHGGTITFESQEGVGTTFTVILPQTENRRQK
jgi:signal transduction histidine kinase